MHNFHTTGLGVIHNFGKTNNWAITSVELYNNTVTELNLSIPYHTFTCEGGIITTLNTTGTAICQFIRANNQTNNPTITQ